MILAVPYCHKDIHQAFRVLKWIAWLSKANGDSMNREKILLTPSRLVSRRIIHSEICELAAKTFGEARCFLPDSDYEQGWPGSCNFMLKETLEHVERHFQDDIFLLEPDAIPLAPEWYDTLKDEWEVARGIGKEFMGNYVNYDIPHMTGIAVYGRNWRKVAPKLAEVQDKRGWDTYAADQILPNAHITHLIQHIWWNPVVSLGLLKPDAVVFHQDKPGKLIGMLDQEYWGGEADQTFGYSTIQTEIIMAQTCFTTPNASKKVKAPGYEFQFERTEQVGGAWKGVYITDKEDEILALRSVVGTINGLKELTPEECAEAVKKKQIPPSVSVVTAPVAPPVAINQSPAVLVENPAPSAPVPDSAVEDVDSLLKIGKVEMAEPPVVTSRRKKKSQ